MILDNIPDNGPGVPRPATNQLTLRTLAADRFAVFGYILGEKIRKRFRRHGDALTFKAEKELALLKHHDALNGQPSLRLTRLTAGQIRDAEAAVETAKGRRLVECVAAAERVLPPIDAISCQFALSEWLDTLTKRERSVRTRDKNKRRVESFLKAVRCSNLVELTAPMLEKWVFRTGAASLTRLTDAQVLQAWLRFAVKRRFLAITPFEIDMKDLTATAQAKAAAKILTPKECHALLQVAASYRKGFMLPYAILAIWCFMRDSEIQKTPRSKIRLDGSTPFIEVDTKKRRTAKYRTVTLPANVTGLLRTAVKGWPETKTVPFSRGMWTTIRERSGILKRGKTTRHKRRPILSSGWQSDIARHTGISYLYQKTGDIKDVCRQAGNKSDVSFRHYLNLPAEGAADAFYSIS